MTQPLVSVCLPAYNHEAYVTKYLDSVLEQDYANKELIVIDDGSTDATAQRIEEWIGHHQSAIPVQYRHRENQGITATLNELISMARGQYIVTASSDDWLLPGSISQRMDFLLSHPDKKAVFGDFHVVGPDDELIHTSGITELYRGRKDQFLNDETLKKEILYRFSIAGPVLLLDRNAFADIGMFDEGLAFEDWDLYLKLSCHHILGFVDIPVAAYRRHDRNISRVSRKSHKHKRKKRTYEELLRTLKVSRYERGVLQNNRTSFTGEERRYIDRRIRRHIRKEIKHQIQLAVKRFFRRAD